MTLARIVSSGLCTGCGACVYAVGDGKLSMELDLDGFSRPVAARPLNIVDERAVREVCPGIGLEHARDGRIPYEPFWGPMVQLFAGYARDPEVRHRASSGGVLSALLINLLEVGKIDFVLHICADTQAPLRNVACFSRTREDVLVAAGSRYAPASPVAAFGDALRQKGRFAFVGKPCDVAAVRKILNARPELSSRVPYLLSFMCAGTPSLQGTKEILAQLEMSENDVVNFRYRGEGWPGYTKAVSRDGRERTMAYNDSWGKILNRYLQARCKKCADGTGELADIACADAWHCKDGNPDFSEADGRSLVIARNKKGQEMLQNALDACAVGVDLIDAKDLERIQPYQMNRKGEMLARSLAAACCLKPWPIYKRFRLRECASKAGLRKSLRAFFGMVIRVATHRI